ncbi:MAG: tetratricopeptide repeat protein, partial [Myxococcales bacterium]|nr:tetratricopeptide repeat protein [Myxococcales bacterium]
MVARALMIWLVLAGLLPAGAALAVSDAEMQAIHAAIADWQTVEARARLEPLLQAEPDEPGLQFAEARLLYFEGRYGDAVNLLDQLLERLGPGAPEAVKHLRAEVGQTHETLKSFDEYVTPDGRFRIRYTGRDKLLMPWLAEVLIQADKALAADFAWRPEGQILVEIYPRIDYLAKVSSLTEEAIETSGTIALCKYNRLMFTSPRGLVKGYGWRDTVTHEFVHYYVTKKSRNTVPIWLHEGIAKFQETRWRTGPGEAL